MNAVSENVANQLKAKGLTVNRIFGENRYETALNVAKEAIDKGVLKTENDRSVVLQTHLSPFSFSNSSSSKASR